MANEILLALMATMLMVNPTAPTMVIWSRFVMSTGSRRAARQLVDHEPLLNGWGKRHDVLSNACLPKPMPTATWLRIHWTRRASCSKETQISCRSPPALSHARNERGTYPSQKQERIVPPDPRVVQPDMSPQAHEDSTESPESPDAPRHQRAMILFRIALPVVQRRSRHPGGLDRVESTGAVRKSGLTRRRSTRAG